MTQNRTEQLSNAGVSIWLDDLSRHAIESGDLKRLIDTRNVVGVTTNPTIFAKALTEGHAYRGQTRELAHKDTGLDDAVLAITTHDVASAADIFLPLYETTDGFDGRVSIEVEPKLAHDAQGTISQAVMLWERLSRKNVMIKIPATIEGLEAITAVTARGISVNVTLIFSLERYRQVIDAYLAGLEQARAAGIDLSTIYSVASFFVSRVDTEIDKRLDEIATPASLALKGKAGVANAQLAYRIFEEAWANDRAKALVAAGARPQRPLWASTGVKDPSYPDTLYVDELVAPSVVNTMPRKTLEAVHDHGEVRDGVVTNSYDLAQAVLDRIAECGISYDEVTAQLEREGVDKFIVSWNELLESVTHELEEQK